MNEQIQNIVNDIQEQFKLNDYFLKRYHIFHEKRSLSEGNYILNMEWFPNQTKGQAEKEDEDLNPEGTVSIDIDFHSRELYRIIFVGMVSNPDAKDIFPTPEKANVINWVEETTGLTFGKQFKIESERDNTFYFRAAIDNINTAPSGMINVEFNEKDELTLFSIDGLFPSEEKVAREPFSLLPENMEHFFWEQFQLVEVPVEENETWLPVYMIEELYIKNNSEKTFPYGSLDREIMNTKLEWSVPLQGPFNPKEEITYPPE
ncbi:MAG TPA: hypothetical protein VK072_02475 [Candidatus Avamphibacillus sp.]|nr:hypothetical protein [Candidatus Avamphibacillus sp.]